MSNWHEAPVKLDSVAINFIVEFRCPLGARCNLIKQIWLFFAKSHIIVGFAALLWLRGEGFAHCQTAVP